MKNARRIYIDLTTGKYHALFIGENVFCYLVEDEFPAANLEIKHDLNTTALIPRIYTNSNEELIPEDFSIVDENTVKLKINSPFTGIIQLLFFTT